jgi:hypothetical protein
MASEAQTILDEIPFSRNPALNNGMLPEIIPAEIKTIEPILEDFDSSHSRTHQWLTKRYNSEFYVQGGTIIHPDDTIAVEGHSFNTPSQPYYVYCEIELDGSGKPVNGVIKDNPANINLPDDTDIKINIKLAELFNGHAKPNEGFYPLVRQLRFEPIRIEGSLNSLNLHPWKVTYGGKTEAEENSWIINLDTIHTCGQGDDFEVIDDDEVLGDSGYVVVKITRGSSSREVTEAKVEFLETLTNSDYNNQYRVLAKVDAGTPETEEPGPNPGDPPVIIPAVPPSIIQYQFEEIRLFEELVIINGAFALQVYEISHQNNYELPL